MNATSSRGTPLATSFSRTSSYTLNVPSAFGVDKSQKINCVPLSDADSSQTLNALSTQRLTLLSGSSGNISLISRWSSASFLPSLVILSILSNLGFTLPLRTASARSAKELTISSCVSLGFSTSLMYSACGTGRFSISAVCTSADSLNREISSGRLKNRANRVFAR